jgi:hypothetical protein
MADTDIHSCGYYCDRHACIVVQRNELRDKLFSDQAVKTYSGGKPNYTQPIEQEPVAYINIEERMLEWVKPMRWETPTVVKMDKVPLYAAPPKKEWVGLTKEEKKSIYREADAGDWIDEDVINAVEAKLREKNA